jgi:hypothetical protein
VGLIPPPVGEKQYAWIVTASGQPARRLTHALGVVGLTSDKTQALILQYPQASILQSPDNNGICVADPPYALVSLADGSVTAPFPGRSDVFGMAIGGQLVAGLSTPVTADKKGCQRSPQLLVRNLLTSHRRHLRPSEDRRPRSGRFGRQSRRTLDRCWTTSIIPITKSSTSRTSTPAPCV